MGCSWNKTNRGSETNVGYVLVVERWVDVVVVVVELDVGTQR